ncbi:Sulfate permease family protein 3 [Aphelenchoides fujianensis]|nr:Sulfate permease family protein 3 [Aphelenchoides fujianensis]
MVARLSFLVKANAEEMDGNSDEWLLAQHVREAEEMEANESAAAKTGAERANFVNQEQFDKIFNYQPAPVTKFDRRKAFRKIFRSCSSPAYFCEFLASFVPIVRWLPAYKWRESLIGDVMGGLTTGIVHIPQGIAYALLAGVDPIYGLYTSFFTVLLYMLFGSSSHMSVGPFAVVALMTGESVREIFQKIDNDYVQAEIRYIDDHSMRSQQIDLHNFTNSVPKMAVDEREIVQAITFTTGLVQLLLAFLRVEFLASYLSDQLVNGFCTGAALHVVVVQLGKLVEIPVRKHSGHLYELAQRAAETNTTALGISIVSFVFLYIGKDQINPRVRRYLPAPIPFELLLIITSTAISAFFSLHETTGISIAKQIPVGLPTARLPRIELIPLVVGDAVEISFVVLALHLSMCRVFNRRLGTKTDNNQELWAFGFMSTISSFFNAYPTTSALGRTMLSVECGVQTQLSALFTALLLLVIILFCGPLLRCLPMACLAVVIVFSIKNIFKKAPSELLHLWRVAKIDFLIWLVAFFSTAVFNVMNGLLVSVCVALLTTVFRIQWPRWRVLSRLSGTEEYRDSGRYLRFSALPDVRIFRFDAPLLFTNVEHFNKSIQEAVQRVDAETTAGGFPRNSSVAGLGPFQQKTPLNPPNGTRRSAVEGALQLPAHHLVIDCSGFTFIDYTSVSSLADIFHQLENRGIRVYFAGAKAHIRDTLEAADFFASVPLSAFYPTIHDAVNAAIQKNEQETASVLGNSKSQKSLNQSSTVSIQPPSLANLSVGIPMGEGRKARSPTQWSLSIRDRRSGTLSEWSGPRARPDELDDV